MAKEHSAMMKSAIVGAVIGAIGATVLGFTLGGWVTTSTAMERTDSAVLASQAEICVSQFMAGPNHEAMLAAFEKTDSWKRYKFIEDGGWDKMPGMESAKSFVSGACASEIEAKLN